MEIKKDNAIYFSASNFYELDNFSVFPVRLWGETFPTSEHAYQWKKYSDTDPILAKEILNAPSPAAVKKLSDAHKSGVSQEFTSNKVSVMEEILRAKLAQHEQVREALKKTANSEIIEDQPHDAFWGKGSEGNGQNMLGKIWMRLRSEL